MVLETGIHPHRVDDEVRVDVIRVRVGSNHNLIAGELFLCKATGDFVCRFRGERFVRMEGLDQLIEHPAIGFSVELLGVHKFPIGILWDTVDTGYQISVFTLGFLWSAAIVQCTPESAGGLGPA